MQACTSELSGDTKIFLPVSTQNINSQSPLHGIMIKYSSDSDAKQQVLITGIDMGGECRISDTGRISSLGDWAVRCQ